LINSVYFELIGDRNKNLRDAPAVIWNRLSRKITKRGENLSNLNVAFHLKILPSLVESQLLSRKNGNDLYNISFSSIGLYIGFESVIVWAKEERDLNMTIR